MTTKTVYVPSDTDEIQAVLNAMTEACAHTYGWQPPIFFDTPEDATADYVTATNGEKPEAVLRITFDIV